LLILGLSLNILALTIISIAILLLGIAITIKFVIDINKINKPYFTQIHEHNKKVFEGQKAHKEESYQNFIKKNH